MPVCAIERHFTAAEVGEMWNLDPSKVRRMFRDEMGVLVLTEHKRGKRNYESIRIPQSVVERVYRRLIR